jgi:hypothetical protein
MKQSDVFSDSKYLSFDLDVDSNDNAVISEVQQWLKRQTGPVLLVLDNAQRQRQLDCILNDRNMRENSFVLVTSHRRDLVAPSDLYVMPTMKDNDALELFRWHSQGASSCGLLKKRFLQV